MNINGSESSVSTFQKRDFTGNRQLDQALKMQRVSAIGIRSSDRKVTVKLSAAGNGDLDGLQDIAGNGLLYGIDVSGSRGWSNAGMMKLKNFGEIEALDVSGTGITDDVIKALNSLK